MMKKDVVVDRNQDIIKEGDMIIDDELVVTITEIIRNIANMEETDQEIALRIINIVRLYLLRDKRVDNRGEII